MTIYTPEFLASLSEDELVALATELAFVDGLDSTGEQKLIEEEIDRRRKD